MSKVLGKKGNKQKTPPNKAMAPPLQGAVSADKEVLSSHHDIDRAPQIIANLLLYTAHGDEAMLELLLNSSPSLIRHLVGRSNVVDYSGRKFQGISAFQYALWALDWHMWNMMLNMLDKPPTKVLPKTKIDKLSDDIKGKKSRELSKKDIAAIRTELLEQYKEVVEKGLDYTIKRYKRIQDKEGNYHLVEPRTVTVKGETHFDLRGLEFCLMPKEKQFPFEKGKLYVKIKDNELHYRVMGLSGQWINDRISLTDLQCPLVKLDTIEQLRPHFHRILNITSERDHTHPQALISAWLTYLYGYDEKWDDKRLIQQWCGGVGMAEREVPAVFAQEICRKDVVLDNRHGEYKEPDFPRTFVFDDWESDGTKAWFPLDDKNSLGLDFGIYSFPDGRAALRRGGGYVWNAQKGRNYEALSALFTMRINDVAALRDQLAPKQHD